MAWGEPGRHKQTTSQLNTPPHHLPVTTFSETLHGCQDHPIVPHPIVLPLTTSSSPPHPPPWSPGSSLSCLSAGMGSCSSLKSPLAWLQFTSLMHSQKRQMLSFLPCRRRWLRLCRYPLPCMLTLIHMQCTVSTLHTILHVDRVTHAVAINCIQAGPDNLVPSTSDVEADKSLCMGVCQVWHVQYKYTVNSHDRYITHFSTCLLLACTAPKASSSANPGCADPN